MSKFTFQGEYAKDRNLRSANLDELVSITFSETDIDRMLTQIAERMVKAGRVASSTKRTVSGNRSDSLTVGDYARELQKSPEFSGFIGTQGAEILEGWLRSSVVIVKGTGKSRTGESIDYLAPLTAAAYRTGFPITTQRHRRADKLVYDLMVSYLVALGQGFPAKSLLEYCKRTLGQGVDFGHLPYLEPKYDGDSSLDINQLLALRLIELFDSSGLKEKLENDRFEGISIPGALVPLGQDLITLFQTSSNEGTDKKAWESSEIFSALRAVIAIRLYQIPLRMAQALRAIIQGQEHSDLWRGAPDAESEEVLAKWNSPLEIYCDFTDEAGGPSDRLAKLCVSRDLDAMRVFFADRMLYRAVTLVAPLTPAGSPFTGQFSRRQMLQHFSNALNDSEYEAAAQLFLSSISRNLYDDNGEPVSEESETVFAQITSLYSNPLQALARLLVASRERDGVEGLTKWLRATGGLQSSGLSTRYALLNGLEGRRTTWKYRPSDELILTLTDMCFLDSGNSANNGLVRARKVMNLEMLLERLRNRYGILIQEPPAEFDSPENRKAAGQNLAAFQSLLRDFGCFDSLSDDFAAQMVRRPRRV